MKSRILLIITAICLLGCNQGGLKMKVRFDDSGGLKNGDRVYHQEEVVGVVTEVIETDEKKYLAALTLKRATAARVTRQNRFYIDQDPKEGNRSAVVMVAGQSGGAPLENGDVIDGSSKSFGFFHHLQEDAQKSLQDVMSQFDQFSRNLKKIPESEEFRQIEKDLKALVDKMVESGEAAKKTIQNEIIPELEKQLKTLKDRLKSLGRENEVEPLEVEVEKLRSNMN